MAPRKKARIGQGANATTRVAVDSIPDDAGEHPRGEDVPLATTPTDSTTPAPTTAIPNPTEGAAIPPPTPSSDPGVFDRVLRGAIQMLAQIVASQAQRSNVAPASSSQQGDSASSRVNRFLQLDPPVFTGTDSEEDPQEFNDDMHKTLRVMHATAMEGVELISYRLKGVACSWFEMWEDSREEGSSPARLNEFVDAFIDHFLPVETKADHVAKFESLK
ncbi:uncharacterized protein [Nicotiana tomentosiformis]|uniref:uncharacterized protein n=1 Tax=Nicotiana tomentosiformis TaxID=4098 RepID=UPI00388CDA3A